MIEIEIDGKTLTAEPGQMLIDVADNAGIYIPRFCYHKKLSIAANCRMCLVEVEKSDKPLPACATPVTAGMKVYTKSPMAIEAQKSVMEFLLINHPLDCPICDQGGECELQDVAMGYGSDVSRFTEGKRAVSDENLGSLISTDMTRCIHCTRCVRFGTEIAGMPELGSCGRGEDHKISTYIKHAMESEVSGNIIDLCPVGALTSKPYRFVGRSWEMLQHHSIAPHDCVGSHLYLHTRGYEYSDFRQVMRVVPRDNESINETWASDRDRFSYDALNNEEKRLTSPMINKGGKWLQVDWEMALNFVIDHLQHLANNDPSQLAGLISPSSTVEEQYLFQKLIRDLGSNNIDHRLRQLDFSQQDKLPAAPVTSCKLEDLDHVNAALLIGSYLRHEQPIANLRLRKATHENANIMSIDVKAHEFNYPLAEQIVTHSDDLVTQLLGVLAGLGGLTASGVESTKQHLTIANTLRDAEKAVIILGALALNHPQAHSLQALAEEISKLANAEIIIMTEGANAAGAWLAGCVPHRAAAQEKVDAGLDAAAMFNDQRAAYLLYNVEPESDCANAAEALQALKDAEFVVSFATFVNDAALDYANVLLPIAPFVESEGTFVNVEGKWQTFQAASPPFAEVRPGWKVLRVMGNLCELPGYEYVCPAEIREELSAKVASMPETTSQLSYQTIKASNELIAWFDWPMYCVDNMVRQSPALQAAVTENQKNIQINSSTAKTLSIQDGDKVLAEQGDESVVITVTVDDAIAENMVRIPAGVVTTRGFGAAFAPITLQGASK